eukprot:6489093-Amphidinium_carterae.2
MLKGSEHSIRARLDLWCLESEVNCQAHDFGRCIVYLFGSAAKGQPKHDKVLGVVGGGRIGQSMVDLALPFGLKCLVYDPYPGASRKRRSRQVKAPAKIKTLRRCVSRRELNQRAGFAGVVAAFNVGPACAGPRKGSVGSLTEQWRDAPRGYSSQWHICPWRESAQRRCQVNDCLGTKAASTAAH